MGFPGDPLDPALVEQWEKNQAAQGVVIDPASSVLPTSSVPMPPSGPPAAGIEMEGMPDYLTSSGTYVPSPDAVRLDAQTEHHPGGDLNLDQTPQLDLPVTPATEEETRAKGIELGMRISLHNDHWEDATVDPARVVAGLLMLTHGDRLELPMNVCVQRIDDDGETLYLVTQGYEGTPHICKDAALAVQVLQTALFTEKLKRDTESAKHGHDSPSIGYSQGQEHQAVIYQKGLNLSAMEDEDGLVWKVACKTGTLALSPGPGQTDAETPLVLTADLFNDMKLSFEEQAFPYVTVPETHNNGALENTGYVRKVDVLNRTQLLADNRMPARFSPIVEADPEETTYLLAGIEFTEPDVKVKALNGSIPDTSIGVKFNYRNKRSGKAYNAAFEHLALTPVPWVDGLIPFGLSQTGVVDAEQVTVPYDGVYTDTLNLTVFNFDPNLHPRDWTGKFKAKASSLKDPENYSGDSEVKLPDGTAVRRLGGYGDEGAWVSDGPKSQAGKKKGMVDYHDSAAEAVAAALKKSDLTDDDGKPLEKWKPSDSPEFVKIRTDKKGNKEGGDVADDEILWSGKAKKVDNMMTDQLLAIVNQPKADATSKGKAQKELDRRVEVSRSKGQKGYLSQPNEGGNILPSEGDRGRILPTADLSVESETEETHMPRTVEEILAEERVRADAAEARIAELEQSLSLSQGTISAQGEQLHTDAVVQKVAALQGKIPPVLLLAAKRIWDADKPGAGRDEDGSLKLSIQTPVRGEDDKITVEGIDLKSPSDIVDYLLSQAPAISGDQAAQIATVLGNVDNLTLSAPAGDNPEAEKKAGVESWERENHPERFADSGQGDRL